MIHIPFWAMPFADCCCLGCKEHQKQKEFMRAMMAGRSMPRSGSGDGPIVASTDFTPNGIATTFH